MTTRAMEMGTWITPSGREGRGGRGGEGEEEEGDGESYIEESNT